MPNTDRRTVRRPAQPRKTTTRESETTMRELLAFIRAAVDLQLHKLKARIDEAFTDYRDPFDVELPELDVADEGVTLDEIEGTLNLVHAVVEPLDLDPHAVLAYIEGTLGIELQQWQRDLVAVYYGEQATR